MASIMAIRRAQRSEGPATILAIGTAVPPNCYLQSDYADYYFRVTDSEHLTDLKDKFKHICKRAQIKKRYLYHTEEMLWKNPNMCKFMAPSLDARQDLLVSEVPKLGQEAALKAIEEWGQDKSKITHLIFSTTTSIDIPGADYQLAKLLNLNPWVNRVMLYMQGCFAGGTVLRIAKDLAENNKGARVLVVCSELVAFGFRGPSENHIDSLISQLLFGDGAAALVVGSDPDLSVERPIFELVSAGQTLVPGSEDSMMLHLKEAGLTFHLSKDVPSLISDNIVKIVLDAFEPLGIKDWNSLFWIVHPGGRAILDQIEEKLSLTKDKLRDSRHVLSEYGNLTSACVFFILDEMRRRSAEEAMATTGEGFKWGVLFGFGPGLTVETVVLRSAPLSS